METDKKEIKNSKNGHSKFKDALVFREISQNNRDTVLWIGCQIDTNELTYAGIIDFKKRLVAIDKDTDEILKLRNFGIKYKINTETEIGQISFKNLLNLFDPDDTLVYYDGPLDTDNQKALEIIRNHFSAIISTIPKRNQEENNGISEEWLKKNGFYYLNTGSAQVDVVVYYKNEKERLNVTGLPGKFRRYKYNPEKSVKKREYHNNLPERYCVICLSIFKPKNKRQKTCSPECNKNYQGIPSNKRKLKIVREVSKDLIERINQNL